MSPEQLKLLDIDEKWYKPLIDTFTKYGISTTKRQAAFLGQCMHESNNFKTLEEDLNYSASALMRVWPSRFPDADVAEKYANNPEKIANKVYAGKMGNTEEGDGWKYHGRGVIQLTGKDNYANCGKSLGVDILIEPSILVFPKFACLSAGWFWAKHGLNNLADAGDLKEITHRVNGGMNGYAERVVKTAEAQKALDTY
jgi:putative chitinase